MSTFADSHEPLTRKRELCWARGSGRRLFVPSASAETHAHAAIKDVLDSGAAHGGLVPGDPGRPWSSGASCYVADGAGRGVPPGQLQIAGAVVVGGSELKSDGDADPPGWDRRQFRM